MLSKDPSKSIEYQEEKGALKADSSKKAPSALPVAGRFAVRPRGNRSVFGVVKTAEGKPAPKDTVIRVINRSLASSEVLGTTNPVEGNDEDGVEAGSYQIFYSVDSFPGADESGANIQIVAEQKAERLKTESKLHFNAPAELEVNLVLQAIPESSPDTLYEKLDAALSPHLDGVAPSNLTEEQETFLIDELSGRDTLFADLPVYLAAQKLAGTLSVSPEAFFALGKAGHALDLETLLAVPSQKLRATWKTAIDTKIIPDLSQEIEVILQTIQDKQLASGRKASNEFVGRLIDESTGKGLVGYRIAMTDLETEDEEARALGETRTWTGGYFTMAFSHEGDMPETGTRTLLVNVSTPEGELLKETKVNAAIKAEEITTIRVSIQETEDFPEVSEFASGGFLHMLTEMHVSRLDDLFSLDEESIEEIQERDEGKELIHRAKWHAFEKDPAVFDAVTAAGYTNVFEVADASRVDLMRKLSDQLGIVKTGEIHNKAKVYRRVMENNMMMNDLRWVGDRGNPDIGGDRDDDVPLPQVPLGHCNCKDCNSAVSPIAYLTDLLKYASRYLEHGTTQDTLTFLTELLHQPFENLPASCRAVTEEISQVRICIEVLRGFDAFVRARQTSVDEEQHATFVQALRLYLRESYVQLLSQMGTSYEELRYAATKGGEEQERLAERLGIARDQLPELLLNIHGEFVEENSALSEKRLETLFGYRDTGRAPEENTPTSHMEIWRKDYLREIWKRLDWAQDGYREDDPSLPIIDPALLTEAYFRNPQAGDEAFDVFTSRQGTLEDLREALNQAIPDRNDLLIDIGQVIGESFEEEIADLRVMYKTFQTRGQTDEFKTRLGKMQIDLAGFTRLMFLDEQAQGGELSQDDKSELKNLLVRRRMRSLFPLWIEEEQDRNLRLGPQHFWMPLAKQPEPPVWLGSLSERETWEEALKRRMQPAIIDPHHLKRGHLLRTVLPPSGGLENAAILAPVNTPASTLWEERKEWSSSRTEALIQALGDLASSRDALDDVLNASALGGGLTLLEELLVQSRSGLNLGARLEQLTLTRKEFFFLERFYDNVDAGVDLRREEWDELIAILISIEKRRLTQVWQQQERNTDITLRPQLFSLYEPESEEITSLDHWLVDLLAHQQWENRLQARIDQLENISVSLKKSVSEVEKNTLPSLRDALIKKIPMKVEEGDSKADALAKRLLIDTKMDGCNKTTRVSQAIESIQLLLFGTSTNELPRAFEKLFHHNGAFLSNREEIFPKINLDNADDFAEEWLWLGSYASWKAAMFVFLFPSLYLTPTTHPKLSWGFHNKLINKASSQLEPNGACKVAQDYASYFEDACHLDIQASCQMKAPVFSDDNCQKSGLDEIRNYLFGLAPLSQKVYFSSYDVLNSDRDSQSSWQPIPGLNDVREIIGCAPHITPDNTRLLLLFVKTQKPGEDAELIMRGIDVESNSRSNWNAVNVNLLLPSGGKQDFTGVVVQKQIGKSGLQFGFSPPSSNSFPKTGPSTSLCLRLSDQRIYLVNIDAKASGWDPILGSEPDNWLPLVGEVHYHNFEKVCALVQRTEDEHILIVQTNSEQLLYRILSTGPASKSRDDGIWRTIAQGGFLGAFSWPGSNHTYVFYKHQNKTRISILRNLLSLEERSLTTSLDIHNWYKDTAGVDLEGFATNHTITQKLKPFPDAESFKEFYGYELNIAEEMAKEADVGLKQSTEKNISSILKTMFEVLIPIDVSKNFEHDIVDILEENHLSFGYESLKQEHEKTERFPKTMWFEKNSSGDKFPIDTPARLSDKSLYYLPIVANDIFIELSVNDKIDLLEKAESKYKNTESYRIARKYSHFFKNEDLTDTLSNFLADGSLVTKNRSQSGFEGENIATLTDIWEIVPSGGEEVFGSNVSKSLAVKINEEFFRLNLEKEDETQKTFSIKSSFRTLPVCKTPLSFMPEKDDYSQSRQPVVKSMYKATIETPPGFSTPVSILNYLYEASHGIPMFIGLQLQQAGYFEEALDWFRMVYDDTQDSIKRKIDYWLKRDENNLPGFGDRKDWLNDPIDPHAIASKRKNAYTRFTLISIIRCYLDLADSLFTIDTVETNARAKSYYEQALALLDAPELKQTTCENLLERFAVEVPAEWRPFVNNAKKALAFIDDESRLNVFAEEWKAIRGENAEPEVKILKLNALLEKTLENNPAPQRLSAKARTVSPRLARFERLSLASKEFSRILSGETENEAKAYRRSLTWITGDKEEDLDSSNNIAWLKEPAQNKALAFLGDDSPIARTRVLTLLDPSRINTKEMMAESLSPHYRLNQTTSSSANVAIRLVVFSFCIPTNPILKALRLRGENNLGKLRSCRNIVGMRRDIEPYAVSIAQDEGLPEIANGQIRIPGQEGIVPTIYRYAVLINRTKELVALAQQMEAAFMSALHSTDQEDHALLNATQGVKLAQSREGLQRLRIGEAVKGIQLARLQKGSAEIRSTTYDDWITRGQNEYEMNMIQAYKDAGEAQISASESNTAAAIASANLSSIPSMSLDEMFALYTNLARATLGMAMGAAHMAAGIYNVRAIQIQTSGQINAALAGFERRNDEWRLQKQLADQDVLIAQQQVLLAQDHLAIVDFEHAISLQEIEFANDNLTFLKNKAMNAEIYRWMTGVLREIYRYFLQSATAMAKLAEHQLAFLTQEGPPMLIQNNYWVSSGADSEGRTDGLTGSKQLLRDVHRLDQHAFEKRQRKLRIEKTFDLAQLFPFEFQEFRQSGVLVFSTPMEWFDRDFPGHYLRLIERVNLSVVAMIPPAQGVSATLTSSGISRTVVSRFGGLFQTRTIRTEPEQIAFTGSSASSGQIALSPDSQELLNPFEGMGVDATWEIRMPRASNRFNYNTLATILFTVEYSALNSFDYRQEVMHRLDRNVRADRAFSFRHDFPDPWYDLNNPDQTDTPLTVGFDIRPEDIPPNLDNVRIDQVMLSFITKDGIETFPVSIDHLHFQQNGVGPQYGGPAQTVEGKVSTRFGNGVNWLSLIGRQPYGHWELSLTDNLELRDRFRNEEITDILFVVSYRAETPPWPQ